MRSARPRAARVRGPVLCVPCLPYLAQIVSLRSDFLDSPNLVDSSQGRIDASFLDDNATLLSSLSTSFPTLSSLEVRLPSPRFPSS